MSSREFVAELKPDPDLRRALFLSAVLIYVVGTWTIFILPVADNLQVLGAAGWALLVAVECGLLALSQLRCRKIRIYCDGSAQLQNANGAWQLAQLSHDCVVLPYLAWLKLTAADGRRCFEPLRGNSRKSQQWRRLQVIWRHNMDDLGSGS